MKEFEEQECMNECIVCSTSNPASLRAKFYSVDKGKVEGVFTGRDEHASYKGRMHGGIIAAVLDEAMGRTLWTDRPDKLAVTATMDVTYGRIIYENEKMFNAEAEIVLPDGQIAAKSSGLYVFQSQEQIDKVLKG